MTMCCMRTPREQQTQNGCQHVQVEDSDGEDSGLAVEQISAVSRVNSVLGVDSRWKLAGIILSITTVVFFILVLALLIWSHSQPAGDSQPAAGGCPEMWQKHKNKLYYVSKNSSSWEDGLKYCEAEGGSLMTLDDMAEEFLQNLFTNQLNHWIGLRKDADTGEWKWKDGTVYNGTVLNGDEPNLQCAHLNEGIRALDCTSLRSWTCEKSL